MTQLAERQRNGVRWSVFLGVLALVLGIAMVVQPYIRPVFWLLLVGLPVALTILLWLPRRRVVTAVVAGAVVASILYLVLWTAAAPTGFPSPYFGSPDATLSVVYGDPGSTRLEVGVDTCNQEPVVTAEETGDEVRLRSNEKVPRGASGDCADHSVVTLQQPLGDRTVIDEATDEELTVRPTESD